MSARTSLAVLLLSIAAPATGAAQPAAPATDPRWSAWLGCWQQLEERVRGGAEVEPSDVPAKGVTVCVTPTENPAAVTFRTIVEQQAVLEETIVADGSNQAIVDPGCAGGQRARWSANGRRLYARAELTCSDGASRTISGLATMAPGPTWVDLQVVSTQGQESVRVRRYRRSPDQSHASGRLTSAQLNAAASTAARQASAFTIDEIKEAVGKVTPSAVEAAIIETRSSFPLNGKRLQELDAAGVPERVIDLMVAVSFPNQFVVEKRSAGPLPVPFGAGIEIGEWWDTGYYYGYYDLFPYHYAPFGYGAWGRYDYYYYGAPVQAVDVITASEPQPTGRGRVVDGLGYTRVRTRDAHPDNPAGMVVADGVSASSGGGGSTSSTGGGGVTSQGYSSGGGDSGRTAVPRPPN